MEGVWNTDMVVGPVRALRDHDVGNHAGEIGLESQRDQVEHQRHLLGEVVELPRRGVGNIQTGKIRFSGPFRTPFEFADRFQVAVENGAVVVAKLRLELPGPLGDEVQDAAPLTADKVALLGRVAFAEQLQEYLPRVVLHRQRGFLIAERQCRVGAPAAPRRFGRSSPRRLPTTAAASPVRSLGR